MQRIMGNHAQTTFGSRDAIVGDFRGNVAATGFRLVLALDRSFTFDYWRDLGGRWQPAARGEYSMDGSLLRFTTPRRAFTRVIEGPFAICDVHGYTALVPVHFLSAFEQAVAAGAWQLWSGMISAGGVEVFTKQPLPKAVVCTSTDTYGHALTRGKRYLVLEERADRSKLRLFGDHGRLRWFPSSCFATPAARPTI
jgi:hypothetical protein